MDAVVFDCDGVLIDSETIGQRIELECLAEIGLVYDPAEYADRYLGTVGSDFFGGLDRDHRARFAKPLPSGFAENLRQRVWEALDADLEAIEGVAAALGGLVVPKAIASGSSIAGLGKKLRKVGLFDAFAPHIYSSEIVPRGKPAPDIFLHAAGKLGISPQRCVAVEDSVNGTLSARAAGMRVVGFTGGGHCTPGHGRRLCAAGAEVVIEHMDNLLTTLGRMS